MPSAVLLAVPFPITTVILEFPTLLYSPTAKSPELPTFVKVFVYGGLLKVILGSITYFVDASSSVSIGKPPNKCCQPGKLSHSLLTVATFVTSLKVSMYAYCPLPLPSLR